MVNRARARLDPKIKPEQKDNSYYVDFFVKRTNLNDTNIWFNNGIFNKGDLHLPNTVLPITIENEILVPKIKMLKWNVI